ncbi:aldose 1-epimerase family protein [Consotaella aegiceratis]|uniref:aldose 1-epimerase family protein n=1 Tax=Consotaella aegiceratis TaxID=3097961 RepID=UPI002F4105F6
MTTIFGRSDAALRERIGSLSQVVRVDSFIEAEGPARGARRLRLVNGGGIELEVHPDRALDLGQMTVGGIPLAWTSPVGPTAPQFYEPEGENWLRTFSGGLLMTCGLDSFGPPSEDAGRQFGLHGRIGAQPARITRLEATAEGVVVEGEIRQVAVFGENLLLKRRISSEAGSDTVTVSDTVTNEGFDPAPHMILYHVNLGWPLLDETTVLDVPSLTRHPRNQDAADGLAVWNELAGPTAGWREHVFRHEFEPEQPVTVGVRNPAVGVEFSLGFDTAKLPYLYQWKMIGQGHYVLGVEPSNCGSIDGRAATRAAGKLPMLEPGASASYEVSFTARRV